jgi:hypothetical protein
MTAARIVATLLLALGSLTRASTELSWSQPWLPPHDSLQALVSPDEYAWRLFIALNWPADKTARKANRSAPLGRRGPVVWETWENAQEV